MGPTKRCESGYFVPHRIGSIDISPVNVYAPQQKGGGLMQAYCMKCRKKVDIKDPKSIVMKNKRPATQGVCPRCGTKVFRIGKS